jgi:hypothetical protein
LIFDTKLVVHEASRSALAHAAPGSDVVVTVESVGGDVVVEVIEPSDQRWALDVPLTEDELTALQLINGLPLRVRAIPAGQPPTSTTEAPVSSVSAKASAAQVRTGRIS